MTGRTGAAGRLAAAFVQSPLTPLFIAGAIALGALAVFALPREEEPQIIVPMIDVFVNLPGATPAEVEQRVTRPLEQLLSEIPGVEYLYSTSSPGSSMIVVRFYVGEADTAALVRLNQKLASSADRIPAGAQGPMVKARSIDDVPIVAITLWGERYDDHTLRLFAGELAGRVKEVPDVSEVTLIGGRPREVRVELDPQRLSTYGLDPLLVQQAIRTANVRATAGGEVEAGATTALRAGLRLETADDVRRVVVAAHRQRAILLSDVASVVDGDARPTSYVAFHERGRSYPAVTLAIATTWYGCTFYRALGASCYAFAALHSLEPQALKSAARNASVDTAWWHRLKTHDWFDKGFVRKLMTPL